MQEAQRSNTSTEFLLWMRFFEWELNEHTPLHYYLAQIALAIYQSVSRKPGKFKLIQFLIKFTMGRKDHPVPADSKSSWLAGLGLTPDGVVKPGLRRRMPPRLRSKPMLTPVPRGPRRRPLPSATPSVAAETKEHTP